MTGIAAAGVMAVPGQVLAQETPPLAKSRRNVWVAGISQEHLVRDTSAEMVDDVFALMEKALPQQPDIICLPEVFPTSNVRNSPGGLEKRVEIGQQVINRLSAFSRNNNCYTIAPVYTHENGHTYNACVLIDRQGRTVGEYRKIYTTEGEVARGITPGPLKPPVFDTDFGKVGFQICFDLVWDQGWAQLKQQGAELVFWSSAYSGGDSVNQKARLHRFAIATSTRKGKAKLCDMDGQELAYSGLFQAGFYCGEVNLDKVFMHAWPYVQKFDAIRAKYGRKVRIRVYHEEEWVTIESLSPDLPIAQIMKEFELKSYEDHKRSAEAAQDGARPRA